jgi:L-asparaginase
MQVTVQRIVVLGTGGTIAGAAPAGGGHLGYRAGQVGVAELLAGVAALQGCPVQAEQLAQVDSKDMDFGVWRRLAARCAELLAQPEVRGVVVTHGTDTIEETAWFLQRVLAPSRPLVLTCAMRPATALVPDGPQNLLDAVTVAATAGEGGVVVACAGLVHAAADVRKVHPYRLDAFDSGEAGPLGFVEDGRLRPVRPWPRQPVDGGLLQRVLRAQDWPRVEIVLNHAGAGRLAVDALVQAGVQGLVAAGTGNGTLHHDLEQALLEAAARGVKVVRTTRCALGQVIAQPDDRLPAHPRSPVKARVDLLLDLLA